MAAPVLPAPGPCTGLSSRCTDHSPSVIQNLPSTLVGRAGSPDGGPRAACWGCDFTTTLTRPANTRGCASRAHLLKALHWNEVEAFILLPALQLLQNLRHLSIAWVDAHGPHHSGNFSAAAQPSAAGAGHLAACCRGMAVCLLLIYKPGAFFVLEDQEALPGNSFCIFMRSGIHRCRHDAECSRSHMSTAQSGRDYINIRLKQLQRSGPVNLEARKRSLKQELKSNVCSLSATWLSLGRGAYVL